MRTSIALVALAAVVLSPASGWADEAPPDAGACRAPDHERAMQIEKLAVDAIRLAVPVFQDKQTLDIVKTLPATLRSAAGVLWCDEPALSPKELPAAQALEGRALKMADDFEKLVAAEEVARTNLVEPLCEAVWGRDNAKADMAHENANPSGYVDTVRLHNDGEAVQQYQAQIKALTPPYTAYRHHAFTSWQTEGACVAEANKPEGS